MHHKINKNHEPTLWALKNSLMLMLSLLSVSISLKSASSCSADSFSPVSFTPSVNSFRLKPLLPSSSILRNTLRHVKQHVYQNNNTSISSVSYAKSMYLRFLRHMPITVLHYTFALNFHREIEQMANTHHGNIQTRIYVIIFGRFLLNLG